jgi:hypothetical protein
MCCLSPPLVLQYPQNVQSGPFYLSVFTTHDNKPYKNILEISERSSEGRYNKLDPCSGRQHSSVGFSMGYPPQSPSGLPVKTSNPSPKRIPGTLRADSHYASRLRSVTVPSPFRQNGLCSHCPSCSLTFHNSTR